MRFLIRGGITISVMESCTGGLFSSCLTDTEGASAVFPGGFVTYSNGEKIRNGVPKETIERFGVYSPQTAEAMAKACRLSCGTEVGVGITGSTGNADPANPDSVPGEAFYAVIRGEKMLGGRIRLKTEGLSRNEIKMRIVKEAAEGLAELLGCEI